MRAFSHQILRMMFASKHSRTLRSGRLHAGTIAPEPDA